MDLKTTEQDIARTKRVLSLRKMTRLSRRAFAKRYGIAPGTLQNWEDVRGNGLSEKGAKRLIKALRSSGIFCSIEWLMQGVGAGPYIDRSLYMDTESVEGAPQSSASDEKTYVASELALFYEHYKEAIDCVIQDDAMLPQFKVGDHVAGPRYYGADISDLIGQECIVVLKDGDLLVRELRQSQLPDHYTLASSNPRTSVAKPVIYDVELVSAAKILWVRRVL